jgi:hypothetical protein
MLDQYDEATALTRGKSLPVYKGIIAEQVFRDWLQSFLPLRYGVTSGYIVPPTEEDAFKITHFDIIIFDRLNSPILWSEAGGVLAIPVEYVLCVIEVKARLTTRSFRQAIQKLSELTPLLEKIDADQVRYKRYLPRNFTTWCVFFEPSEGRPRILADWITLTLQVPRACPAVFIVRSQRHGKNASALINLYSSPSEFEGAHKAPDGNFYHALGYYSDWHFQRFAFTLLANIEGRQDQLYPSFHALPPSESIEFVAAGPSTDQDT